MVVSRWLDMSIQKNSSTLSSRWAAAFVVTMLSGLSSGTTAMYFTDQSWFSGNILQGWLYLHLYGFSLLVVPTAVFCLVSAVLAKHYTLGIAAAIMSACVIIAWIIPCALEGSPFAAFVDPYSTPFVWCSIISGMLGVAAARATHLGVLGRVKRRDLLSDIAEAEGQPL